MALIYCCKLHTEAAASLYDTDKAGVLAVAQANIHELWPIAIHSTSLPFNGLHPMDYCSFTGGMEG